MTYITGETKEEGCVFCNLLQRSDGQDNLVVHRGESAFVMLNRFPYTSGHVMVLPYAHQSTLDALTPATRAEMMELATRVTLVLGRVYRAQGFNIGINQGDAAGAGIAPHIHLHIVPRWSGDTNFMTAIGSTRVLPEALEDSWQRIKEAWEAG